MDFLQGGFLCKAQCIVSSIFKIMSWTSSTLSFPMQTLNQFPPHDHHLGLKTLIHLDKETPNNIIHSFAILSPPPSPSPSSSSSSTSLSLSSSSSSFGSPSSSSWSSPSSSWSSMMGDLIGSESGVYTSPNADELEKIDHEPYKYGSKRNQRCDGMMKKTKKEYPPPIPLLARTENLPGHMPWVLTRHYVDGKLILKEKRVKHHEYFEAHRVNGRLILTLVPLDNAINCCHAVCDYNAKKISDYEKLHEEEEEEDDDHVDKDDDGVVMKETSMAIVASHIPKSCGEKWTSTISSDSNFFGLTIPMNRAVPT